MNLGFGELLIILVIVLVLFGAGRLPALGEGIGKAIRGFKDGMKGEAHTASPGPRTSGEGAPGPKRELPPDGGAEK